MKEKEREREREREGGKEIYYIEIYINKISNSFASRYLDTAGNLQSEIHAAPTIYEKRNANFKLISNKKLVSQMS